MTSIFRGFSKFNFELEILHLGGNILYQIELINPKCETWKKWHYHGASCGEKKMKFGKVWRPGFEINLLTQINLRTLAPNFTFFATRSTMINIPFALWRMFSLFFCLVLCTELVRNAETSLGRWAETGFTRCPESVHIVPGEASSLGAITTLTDYRVKSFRLLWLLKYNFLKFLTSSFWDMATLTCIFWEPWKSIYIFLMFLWF